MFDLSNNLVLYTATLYVGSLYSKRAYVSEPGGQTRVEAGVSLVFR